MRSLILSIVLTVSLCGFAMQTPFYLGSGKTVGISCDDKAPVVLSALEMLSGDMLAVLSDTLVAEEKAPRIIASTYTPAIDKHLTDAEREFIFGAREGFVMKVLSDNRLLIAGSDSHGTAYGLLELSRLLGVSPWEWWADATPQHKDSFVLPADYSDSQAPSVDYRGIFINDEDWGLMPWSSQTMEPGNKRGIIGPKTNEKIFQLLLRLRANYYWPAMHEVTEPFFLTPGNREMAEKYGIYIGGSHCEPMASSTAVEWKRRGKGTYDYVNNRDSVLQFWEDRVRDVAGQEIVYTLGMRGVHDSAMLGAKTVEDQKKALEKVLADQRELIAKYVNEDVRSVPQVFIPYKEVLDVYHAGLEVPDDVTLMWCDDNYGYIRHFPTAEEQARRGGNGIYYHVSYWGRPHDYLWLGTFSPYLLYQQMSEAYRHGIKKMWILNVGDIKPAEYQTELFMDMAWDFDAVAKEGVQKHMQSFLAREFGRETAAEIQPIMDAHYRLAFIRRPEFMGNTRTEERDRKRWNTVTDLPWSDSYVSRRLADYARLSDAVESTGNTIAPERRDEYFQLVKYPVQAAAQMNNKMLYGQLARHGKADWNKSQAAYDSIVALTKIYNQGIANGGKWRGIMDMRPRKLAVFDPLTPGASCEAPVATEPRSIDVDTYRGEAVKHPGLGRSGRAIGIPEGKSVSYTIPADGAESLSITLSFLPNHPMIDGGGLKVSVSCNGGKAQAADYSTQGRSEEWKENMLNNRATRTFTFPVSKGKDNTITITALTPGVILDEIEI